MSCQTNFLDGTVKYEVNIEGESSGETYKGVFTAKGSQSPMDVIKSDRLYRELLGEGAERASTNAANLAFALSYLKYAITQPPSWWPNEELDGSHLDNNVILKVFQDTVDAQAEYREKRKKKSDKQKKVVNKKFHNDEIEAE